MQQQQDRAPTISLESVLYHEIKYSTSTTSRNLAILYTASIRAADEWAKARLEEYEGGGDVMQFGIDTESKPQFVAGYSKQGPVVLQLATAGHALVFQLNACKDSLVDAQTLAPSLYAILSPDGDSSGGGRRVELVGMGLRSDYYELGPIFGWAPAPPSVPPTDSHDGPPPQGRLEAHYQALLKRTCTSTIMGEACSRASCTALHILPAVTFAAIDAAKRRIAAHRAKREERERRESEGAAAEPQRPRYANLLDLEPLKMGGLQSMAQSVLGVVGWKSKRLQLSQWQQFPHTRERLVYAAMDAWAAAGICEHYRDPPFPSPPLRIPKETRDEEKGEGEGEEEGEEEGEGEGGGEESASAADQQQKKKRRRRKKKVETES